MTARTALEAALHDHRQAISRHCRADEAQVVAALRGGGAGEGGEVGGALKDLALKFVVRLLQRLARGKAVAQVAAPLVDHHRQNTEQQRRNTGDGGADRGGQRGAGPARADAREARASYDANFIKARNDLELEQSKYERNQYLYSIGAISQDTLDKVKQEYLASKATFDVLADQVQDGSSYGSFAQRYDEYGRFRLSFRQ